MELIKYGAILLVLLILELLYFRLADRFNIIDKPNQRSSHSRIVLRGGGIIFAIALWLWSIMYGCPYPWLLAGVTLAAGVSFIDDIHSLPDSLRLVVQFVAAAMVLYPCIIAVPYQGPLKVVIPIIALIVAVGATNIFNFMDGINGITGGYALAILIPILVLNQQHHFVDESLLIVICLSLLVFSFFNFRKKAKCFAGDVGSIGMALMLVFCIGRLMYVTGDVSWIVLYLIYGIDGMMTILHRIMLHENLGQAHRKHAYQLMANELKIPHVAVSTIYMVLQLAVSLIAIYVIPDTILAHWIYLIASGIIMAGAYIVFMCKYYHLHEDYLRSFSLTEEKKEPKETATPQTPSKGL